MANTIAKQYTRLLTLWPKDALRPNLPFTRTIEHRGLPFGVQPLAPATPDTSPSKSSNPTPTIAAKSTAPPPSPSNPQLEQHQINALFSLLDNKFAKKYPLSPDVLKPKSAPQHYVKLMEEIEKAPKKSWWEAKVDEWKMKIRWS
ncbi:hypothetical protein NX059_003280 [Plenodomus lindquistii]|nr:hypothetical protein NX059_003280 [Plenodomus lindquistii]